MKSLPVANIVNSLIYQDNFNIVYDSHGSLFDLIIKSMDFSIHDVDIAHSDMWYHSFLTNDAINFTNKYMNTAISSHLNTLAIFHDGVPPQLKKEDIMILQNQIKNSIKILTDGSLASQWLPSDDKWYTVNYGIPYIEHQGEDRTIDCILFNFRKNNNITSLFDSIKQSIPNSMIMNELPKSLEELYSILDKTKICIDFDNRINSLVAASRGCFNITSYENTLIGYYERINSTESIDQIILNCLHQIDKDKTIEQIDFIKQHYSFDIFAENLTKIISHISKEVFLL